MSDELASALRELANEAARPPVLTGAEIRGRATSRRRRRRTALAAAGVSLAGTLALVVVGPDGGTRHEPAPAASAPVTSPDATIDLGERVITVGGHRLTVHGGTLTGDTPTVRMTVTAKEAHLRVSGETVGLGSGYFFQATWALRLTGPDGRTDYVGSLSNDEGIYDPDHGWIGLDMADAKLLYDRLERGAVVEIRPSASASAS
ncbi:L,D-transpeptidase [Streptomyces sp. BF23-18]|uniref:L,D-transpeptidase n=1 Tax=Streptomyces sp. BF23-18 TaxID=3240282 RepID=UPI0034E42A50